MIFFSKKNQKEARKISFEVSRSLYEVSVVKQRRTKGPENMCASIVTSAGIKIKKKIKRVGK